MPTTPPRRPPAAPAAPPSPATRPVSLDTSHTTGPKSGSKVLPPDSRVGRYVIRKPVGKGGMGCVYLAWDDDLRRTVAVKVMHPDLANESEHRQRFLREARAMAALSHDNVVNVYEVGQSNGLVFYAMPHLTGVSLVQFLNERGRPSVTAACRIAREIASGLAAAHARNLLHRDIKPGNIFLEAPRGRVKLLDFGLATSASGDGRLTQPGMVVGTPAYMSPEQARGLPLDARADLFSLGAVMYHLTTGRMPFEGPDSLAVLTALAVDTPPPVREANPKVPARLETLIDRLLSKSVDGRPDSAHDVVAELKAVERELADVHSNGVTLPVAVEAVIEDDIDASPSSDGDPVTPVPTRRRRKKKAKKGKWQQYKDVALIAAGVAGLLALVLGVTLLLANLNRTPAKANAPATPTAPTREPGPPWSEVGQEGQTRWKAVDRQGQVRQLPDWWRPGMPLPPEFPPPARQ